MNCLRFLFAVASNAPIVLMKQKFVVCRYVESATSAKLVVLKGLATHLSHAHRYLRILSRHDGVEQRLNSHPACSVTVDGCIPIPSSTLCVRLIIYHALLPLFANLTV